MGSTWREWGMGNNGILESRDEGAEDREIAGLCGGKKVEKMAVRRYGIL